MTPSRRCSLPGRGMGHKRTIFLVADIFPSHFAGYHVPPYSQLMTTLLRSAKPINQGEGKNKIPKWCVYEPARLHSMLLESQYKYFLKVKKGTALTVVRSAKAQVSALRLWQKWWFFRDPTQAADRPLRPNKTTTRTTQNHRGLPLGRTNLTRPGYFFIYSVEMDHLSDKQDNGVWIGLKFHTWSTIAPLDWVQRSGQSFQPSFFFSASDPDVTIDAAFCCRHVSHNPGCRTYKLSNFFLQLGYCQKKASTKQN